MPCPSGFTLVAYGEALRGVLDKEVERKEVEVTRQLERASIAVSTYRQKNIRPGFDAICEIRIIIINTSEADEKYFPPHD